MPSGPITLSIHSSRLNHHHNLITALLQGYGVTDSDPISRPGNTQPTSLLQQCPPTRGRTEIYDFGQRSHRISKCPLFALQEDVNVRRRFVNEHRLCYTCLARHLHRDSPRKDQSCSARGCSGKHHSLFTRVAHYESA